MKTDLAGLRAGIFRVLGKGMFLLYPRLPSGDFCNNVLAPRQWVIHCKTQCGAFHLNLSSTEELVDVYLKEALMAVFSF